MTIEAIEPEKKEIRLRTVVSACTAEHWQIARVWLYYTLFYWMFPTLIVIFGLLVGKREVKWVDLVIHGEFLIYSITLAAGSTRLIAKDIFGSDPFVNRQGFNLVAQVMIFPAIFTYGLVRYIGLTSDSYAVSTPIVVTYSVVLLIAAFGFSFLVFLIDAQRSSSSTAKQVAESIQHAPDKLNEDFDALQDGAQNPADAGATTVTADDIKVANDNAGSALLNEDFDEPQDGK